MVNKRMYEANKREGELYHAEHKWKREQWMELKKLKRKWIDMDFSEEPRLYKGCDNCRYYSDRKCQRTGEELTMVCEEWEGRSEE